MHRTTSLSLLASAALLAASTLLGSCGGEQATPNLCVPGRTVQCSCEGGTTGLQTCAPDGSGYEACGFCSLPPSAPRGGFTDATNQVGTVMEGGSCLALEDFDHDGNVDLLLSAGSIPANITIRSGLGGGQFANFPSLFLEQAAFSSKCVTGDFDNDGWTDIVIVHSGKGPEGSAVEYWKNLGGLQFQMIETAFDYPYMPDQFIVGVAAWDYDNDGWLDLVVGRLFQASGTGGQGSITDVCKFTSEADFRCLIPMSNANPGPRVYRNDKGVFRITEGVLKPPFPVTTNAMAVVDLNRDGKTDLLMSNDYYNNHYHLSSPDGFVHAEDALGITAYNHGMGITAGDFDGDGTLDIYGVDVGPNNLWYGSKNGTMTNRALDLGLAAATHFHSNWAPLAEDFDLDGRTDLFVAAAAVVTNDMDLIRMANSSGAVEDVVPQYDMIFWNENNVGFSELKLPHRGVAKPNVIHAVSAVADTDGDGDLDIAVGAGNPLVFTYLKNEQAPGNWLVVDVEGTKTNRDGIGVEVQLVESGIVRQIRTIGMQGSLGQSWHKAHFGLANRDFVDEVRVRWTTGKIQSVKNVKANQTILVTEE